MEQIRSPLVARRMLGDGNSLVIHACADLLIPIRNGDLEFFAKLVPFLARKGLPTRVVEAGGSASKILQETSNVHIVAGDFPGYGRNMLHAMHSYIWGFWYLDEVGVHCNSSLRFARFCPENIDAEKAEYFFNGVSGHMLRENVSKTPQEARIGSPMQPASTVIFCQDIEERDNRSHYLNTEEMIRVAAETRRDELVYVKPHPTQSKVMRRIIMATCSDYTNVKITDASIHDLVDVSRVVVTQNSAAGFEALMQKKTVITCAKSDYWHATLTPRTIKDLGEAIELGPRAMHGFEYEKYLYWFLDRNCLEPQKDAFTKRAWARIRDKAFL